MLHWTDWNRVDSHSSVNKLNNFLPVHNFSSPLTRSLPVSALFFCFGDFKSACWRPLPDLSLLCQGPGFCCSFVGPSSLLYSLGHANTTAYCFDYRNINKFYNTFIWNASRLSVTALFWQESFASICTTWTSYLCMRWEINHFKELSGHTEGKNKLKLLESHFLLCILTATLDPTGGQLIQNRFLSSYCTGVCFPT